MDNSEKKSGALNSVIGFFNNVILNPLKNVNEKYEDKAKKLAEELECYVNKIPENQLQEAPVNILGPSMESLKYNIEEDGIKEMFIKLLTSSMDKRKNPLTHPSYVRIIEQMDSVDARLFQLISTDLGFQNGVRPIIVVDKEKNQVAGGLPEIVIEFGIQGCDMYDISRSMVRLEKFGLVTFYDGSTAGNSNAQHLLKRDDLQRLLVSEKNLRGNQNLELTGRNVAFRVNDYGSAFARVCLY